MNRGRIVRQHGKDMHTLLHLKWITNKDLLCSPGNSVMGSSLDGRGEAGEFRGERIHVYVWLSRSAVHLKLSQPLLSDYSPI